MEIKVIKKGEVVTRQELEKMAVGMMENLVKAVVDVGQGIMAVGGYMHADELTVLMEQENSTREHTWGVNIYPKNLDGNDWLEFDSMINLKPWLDNRTRGVEDENLRNKIQEIVSSSIAK